MKPDFRLEKIILGTVQLGTSYGVNNYEGKPNKDQAFEILDTAYAQGIQELDTAADYGDSESIIGAWQVSRKKNFKLMSKASDLNEINFLEKIKRSCGCLKVSFLEGFYFHRFSDFREMKSSSLFHQVKQAALVRNLGVSLYDIEDLRLAVSHPEVDVIQLPYNMLDRSTQKQELLLQARTAGKKIYSRSAFLQGLFFMDADKLPKGLSPLKKSLTSLQKIARENDISIEELALGFVSGSPYVDKVLIGVDSPSQLRANLLASRVDLKKQVRDKIEQILVSEPKLLNPSTWWWS